MRIISALFLCLLTAVALTSCNNEPEGIIRSGTIPVEIVNSSILLENMDDKGFTVAGNLPSNETTVTLIPNFKNLSKGEIEFIEFDGKQECLLINYESRYLDIPDTGLMIFSGEWFNIEYKNSYPYYTINVHFTANHSNAPRVLKISLDGGFSKLDMYLTQAGTNE